MRSLKLLTLVALVLVSACADEPPGPPPGQMAATLAKLRAEYPAPADYVAALLQAAPTIPVELSQDDLQRVLQAFRNNYPGANSRTGLDEKGLKEEIAACNNNGYQQVFEGVLWQTAETECDKLGDNLAPPLAAGFHDPALGSSSPQAEVAYARSCTLPLVQGVMVSALGCAHLIQLYQDRGSLEEAAAVLQAQKCQGSLSPEASVHAIDGTAPDGAHDALRNCLVDGAEVLHKLQRFAEERMIDENLCHGADELGCDFLAALGASVNMAAVEEKQRELQAADQARAEAVREQRVENEASFDAKTQALRSAADSNSNAIVDTANQAAANMIAVGAANDAAREARYRQEQEARRREREAASAAQESSGSSAAPANTHSSAPVAGTESGGAAGSSSNQAPSAATGGTCTSMNAYVTGKVWVGSDGIVAGSLTNTSSQPVSVGYTFQKGGQPDPNQAGVITLQPGQTIGGEMSGIESDKSQVDVPPKLFWSAVLASDANKPCGLRNPWRP